MITNAKDFYASIQGKRVAFCGIGGSNLPLISIFQKKGAVVLACDKRDREKLKEQKRQEKQKRKDERKSGGTSSFEDMIAYVDENGILHTTPQDVKPKTEIDVSQIEISTPKQEEMEILPSTGRVEYFTASKGYGFIKDADSGEKYFFHISSAPDTIAEGDKVTFEIERGTRGLAAVRISIINKQ